MLFGTWKKVFKSACLPDAGRLLHNRCNLMAPIKKFFQLRFFLSLFFYAKILFHVIYLFKAYFHCDMMWWFPPIVSIVVDPFLTPKMLWFGDFSWPFFIWIWIRENLCLIFMSEKSTEAKEKRTFYRREKIPQNEQLQCSSGVGIIMGTLMCR